MTVYNEIENERMEQDKKWGGPKHDDTHTHEEWMTFIYHHLAKSKTSEQRRYQLVRVAALVVAAIESNDRIERSKEEQ
jgi:hypothetical protein